MNKDKVIREYLIKFLQGGQAYMPFEEAVADFPTKHINTFPPNVTYTFWHILEHIRITQWDILDFSRNPQYKYIKWPDAYWPKVTAKAGKKDWDKTVRLIKSDLNEMIQLIKETKNDLYKPFPWGEGQNLFREAMLIANHNAYHIGEFAILRQVTNTWAKKNQ